MSTAQTSTYEPTPATPKLSSAFNGAITFLDRDPNGPDAVEWSAAWRDLKRARALPADDFDEECKETGEVWQYMLSYIPTNPNHAVVHEFRHRCARDARDQHPAARRHDHHIRQHVNVPASPEFAAKMRAAAAELRPSSTDYSIPPEGDEA